MQAKIGLAIKYFSGKLSSMVNKRERGRPPKYGFAGIRLGRSIIVLGAVMRTLSPAAHQWAKRHGRRFRLFTVPTGVQVKRLE